MKKEIIEVLERHFNSKDIKSRPGGFGKSLSYVQGHHVLGRLNEAFGGDYSIEIVDKQIVDNNVIVHVRLSVDQDGKTIVRDAIGGKTMMNKDLVSNYKAAVTDAIKKAAATLGVALHLYGADETEEDEKEEKVVEKSEDNVRVPISETQKKAIAAMLVRAKLNKDDFFKANGVTDLDRLTEGQAKELIEKLNKVGK